MVKVKVLGTLPASVTTSWKTKASAEIAVEEREASDELNRLMERTGNSPQRSSETQQPAPQPMAEKAAPAKSSQQCHGARQM